MAVDSLPKYPRKVLTTLVTREITNSLEQLNETMAAATTIESTESYINADKDYQSALSKELYRCQNLIDRFQMYIINHKNQLVMLKSKHTSIYLTEIKMHTAKLNQIVTKLEQ